MIGVQYVEIVYVDDDGIEVHATERAPLIATEDEWLQWWDTMIATHDALMNDC